MPPRPLSRYALSAAIDGNAKPDSLILTERVPFRYQNLSDNRHYNVADGDTLFTIADKFFRGIGDRPAGLWWVIADFQPEPIHDPTLALDIGRVLVIPSVATVLNELFSEERRVD